MAKVFKVFTPGIKLKPINQGLACSADPSACFCAGTDCGSLYTYCGKFRVYIECADREIITNDQAQTLTQKTIQGGTITSPILTVCDNELTIQNACPCCCQTAKFQIDCTQTACTLAALILPKINDTLAGIASAQTLTNKTVVVACNTITTAACGNLTSTELNAALGELQTDIDTRVTCVTLTCHICDTTTHGTTGCIVGTSDCQTLTNKTIQGASQETPSRSDVKQDTEANLVTYACGASNGQLVFATDSKEMFQVIDCALESVGGGGLLIDLCQACHGFAVGNGIYFNACCVWAKGQSDCGCTLATYTVIEVPSTGNFIATNFGRITATGHGYTVGDYYWLSGCCAGVATSTEPTTGYSNPLFLVEDANTLQIFVYRPSAITSTVDLNDLTDVSAASPNHEQVLTFCSSCCLWKPANSSGGGGGGSLDTFHSETFECGVCCFTTGNNACFDNGGCAVGTLAGETCCPLNGGTSLKYTSTACAACDWIASPTILLDAKQVGNKVSIIGYTTYSGDDNDLKIVIFDDTCNEIISVCCSFIKATTIPRRFSFSACVPTTSANIKWGFKTVTGNACAILVMDDVEITTAPREVKEIFASTDWADYTPTGSWASNTTYTGTWRRLGDSMELRVNQYFAGQPSSGGTDFELPTGYSVDTTKFAEGSADFQVVGEWFMNDAGVTSYGGPVSYRISTDAFNAFEGDGTAGGVTNTAPVTIASGDSISITVRVPIEGWKNTSNGTVFATDSNKEDIVVYGRGNNGAALTANVTNINWTEVDDNQDIFDGTTAIIPETGIYTFTGNIRLTAPVGFNSYIYIDGVETDFLTDNNVNNYNNQFSTTRRFLKGQAITFRSNTAGTLLNNDKLHWISITKQGLDLDNLIVENFGNIVSACGLGTGDLENVFSANIDGSAGACSTITSQSSTFICTVVGTGAGSYTLTWVPCFFSVIPSLVGSVTDSNSFNFSIKTLTTTGATLNIRNTNSDTDTYRDFSLVAQRQGTDYQSKANYIDNLVIENPCGEFTTETKILSACQTSDATMSDLTFTTVVGEKYLITGQYRAKLVPNSDTSVEVNVNDGCTQIFAGGILFNVSSGDMRSTIPISHIYTATATSLTFVTNSSSANAFIRGNGTTNSEGSYVQLTALPKQLGVVPGSFRPVKIGYVKDVKTSGTHGGSSTVNTVHTRNLNTTSGDFAEFGTLACCQITLTAGTYHIEASIPAQKVIQHQSFLHDGTSYVIDGSSEVANSTSTMSNKSFLEGQLVIAVSTTYEIRHWVGGTVATTGLGFAADAHASNPQAGEVYTQVKITKIV